MFKCFVLKARFNMHTSGNVKATLPFARPNPAVLQMARDAAHLRLPKYFEESQMRGLFKKNGGY